MSSLSGEEMIMDLETLRGFRELINRRSGLSYDDAAQSLFERRFAQRVRELSFFSFAEYLELLRSNDAELEHVFETLTTKETYFFRQEYQLSTFVDEVVPLVVKNGAGTQGRLTVWSAGCSTGEEAYTLAMLLSQHESLRHWKVRVLGTDLCPSNVELAERAIYRESSFRSTSEQQRAEFFTEAEEGYKVNSDIQRMCHFSAGNLVNASDVRSVGRVDVIFCRNVLIYFDQKSRQTTTNLFYERLLPGGFLLLGHSESLLNTDTRFEPVHLEGDLVYQRPLLDGSSQSKIKV